MQDFIMANSLFSSFDKFINPLIISIADKVTRAARFLIPIITPPLLSTFEKFLKLLSFFKIKTTLLDKRLFFDTNGETFLTLAVMHSHMPIFNALLYAGANVDAVNRRGETPLYLAIYEHSSDCFFKRQPQIEHIIIINTLIQAGANFDTQSDPGRNTPLIIAASDGDAEVFNILIRAGAKLDPQNSRGFTALICAVLHGDTNLAKALIQAGANLEIVDQYGRTALMWAAENGHIDIANALIQGGANVTSPKFGQTALTLANKKGHTEIAFSILRAMSLEQIATALQNNPNLNDIVNQFKQINKLNDLVQNKSLESAETSANLADLNPTAKTLILSQKNNLKPYPRKNDELYINTDKIAEMMRAKRAA